MSKTFHILNGDALLDFFPEILPGEIIIARECMVDGPTAGSNLDELWQVRASFIAAEYGESNETYFSEVVSEFQKIDTIPSGSEVNLWFEEDLFCQVNLWFCMSLLLPISEGLSIQIVKPPLQNGKPDWGGFGSLGRNGLAEAYLQRKPLSKDDIKLLAALWDAYKIDDNDTLEKLGKSKTEHFPFLNQVIQAQLARSSENGFSGRPERTLKSIMEEMNTSNFKTIFTEFSKREGIYGFGDWQVERLMQKMADHDLGTTASG